MLRDVPSRDGKPAPVVRFVRLFVHSLITPAFVDGAALLVLFSRRGESLSIAPVWLDRRPHMY